MPAMASLAVLAADCSATRVDATGVRWRSRRPACDGVIVPSALENGLLHFEVEDCAPRNVLLSIDDGRIVHSDRPLP